MDSSNSAGKKSDFGTLANLPRPIIESLILGFSSFSDLAAIAATGRDGRAHVNQIIERRIAELAEKNAEDFHKLMLKACALGNPALLRMCINALNALKEPARLSLVAIQVSKDKPPESLTALLKYYYKEAMNKRKHAPLIDTFRAGGLDITLSLPDAVASLNVNIVQKKLEEKLICPLNVFAQTYNTGYEKKEENQLRHGIARMLIQGGAEIVDAKSQDVPSVSSLFNTIVDKQDVELLKIIKDKIELKHLLLLFEAINSKSDVSQLWPIALERAAVLLSAADPALVEEIGQNYLYSITSAVEENDLSSYVQFISALRNAGFNLDYADNTRNMSAYQSAVHLEKNQVAAALKAIAAGRSFVSERKRPGDEEEAKRANPQVMLNLVGELQQHLTDLDSYPTFTGAAFFDAKAQDPRVGFRAQLEEIRIGLNTSGDNKDRMSQLLTALQRYAKSLETDHRHYWIGLRDFLRDRLELDINQIQNLNASGLTERLKENAHRFGK
jgi:hypothetical protein